MSTRSDIEDLLEGAVAAVSADRHDAGRIGTAFRITPDYAVTAAHVTELTGPELRLRFGDGSECLASVAAASARPADGGRWGFDDLAVLRLDRPDRVTAPCVLMTEPALTPAGELLICALNSSYKEPVVEVYKNYRVRDIHPRFFTIDGDNSVIGGMSGAPVWSVPHGGVVGFVKASENTQSAQGGAIVSLLEGLRRCDRVLYEEIVTAHDAHHRDDKRWADRTKAPLRRWVMEAQGWLALIPTAAARRVPVGLVDELFRDSLPPQKSRLVTLRDLAEYIGTESQNSAFDLARFCALAPNYLHGTPVVAQGLRDIPDKIVLPREYPEFERRYLADRTDTAEFTTIFGVIVPQEGPRLNAHSPVPHRYELARRTGDQEIIALDSAGRCGSYDQAERELKQALDIELSTIEKPLDAVEIVIALPDEHLTDVPLYDWRRPDERPFSKFTMRLRRSCTWEKSSEQLAELDVRWKRLRRGGPDGLVWFGCGDSRAQSLPGLQVLFAEAESPDGVAISEPPTAAVLTASMSNALPVNVWRTVGCADHPDGGAVCDGTAFRGDMGTRIGEGSPLDWYAAVWRGQRERIGSVERDEFWRKIVCIIDRPGESRRRPPPLAGPGATREWV